MICTGQAYLGLLVCGYQCSQILCKQGASTECMSSDVCFYLSMFMNAPSHICCSCCGAIRTCSCTILFWDVRCTYKCNYTITV